MRLPRAYRRRANFQHADRCLLPPSGGSGVYVLSGESAANLVSTVPGRPLHLARRFFVDTTGGAKTMTLPTGVTIGDTVRINDLAGTFGTNNLTVARNGSNIQGIADDLVVSVNQSSFGLVYSNGTYGWKLLEF